MVAPGMRRSESREKTGSGFRRSLLASLTALAVITTPSVVVAEDDNSGFSGNRLWTNQLQDYALKSLQNEDAMSMAAIPLNGPGINQYINADALMSPGSIMKLVTTFAALEVLGPNHHWDTDFLTDGAMVGDTLKGNLYVRFGGDPKLTIERLWTTLGELRSMGITRIEGDLILDGSLRFLFVEDK